MFVAGKRDRGYHDAGVRGHYKRWIGGRARWIEEPENENDKEGDTGQEREKRVGTEPAEKKGQKGGGGPFWNPLFFQNWPKKRFNQFLKRTNQIESPNLTLN